MERFTISLDDKLAHDFDAWIASRAYANRSEAVRDLLRAELERSHRREDGDGHGHCIGCLSYVYNHHERELAERLTALQHEHHELTISAMHAHLDHENCIEAVILHGEAASVQRFADAICAERGVRHGKLNLISAELGRPHRHARAPHVHLKPSR